ncbi:MAG: hypothetical protein ACLTSK_03375 [Christensenellales bacterium]
MIIAALSTPHGRGAINVIRLSGEGCKKLAAKMFSPFPTKPTISKRARSARNISTQTCACFSTRRAVYRRGRWNFTVTAEKQLPPPARTLL